jgi:hypothetical protein
MSALLAATLNEKIESILSNKIISETASKTIAVNQNTDLRPLKHKAAASAISEENIIVPAGVSIGMVKITAKHPKPDPNKLKKYMVPLCKGILLKIKPVHNPDIRKGMARTM